MWCLYPSEGPGNTTHSTELFVDASEEIGEPIQSMISTCPPLATLIRSPNGAKISSRGESSFLEGGSVQHRLPHALVY